MSDFHTYNNEELQNLNVDLRMKYNDFKNQKLKLDMSRGKPCSEQLDLSRGLLEVVNAEDSFKSEDGTDTRNYGGLDGIPEAKKLFADMLEVSTKEIVIGGSSSLTMMHDTLSRAMLHGVYGSKMPWSKLPVVKFLCPSPGYDRHFAICELFNMEMILINMNADGPDMEQIEQLVAADDAIKGIWCVPKYSNPDGITYSDKVVNRLAKMNCKAEDFRIIWDDAYCMHHLTDTPDPLKNILEACKAAGNADRVFMFSSTSKISFAGSGVAMMAASEANLSFIKKQLSIQTIGPDKINQLRHVRFYKDISTLQSHMKKQSAIIKPKFDAVLSILDTELNGKHIASWNKPKGGYFISLNTLEGCATAVVAMAAEAGVTLTNAGATYPYGKDPLDRNIRIAPTFPTLEDVKNAIEVLCLCVQIVSVQKLLVK